MQTTYQTTRIQYYLDYLIEHCILAVAFFLPLSLNITSIFLTAGAVFWLSKMLVTRRLDFKRTPFDWLIALLVVLSAASILASPDRSFSFYNYYHLMGRYILLYYLVVNHVQSLDQLKRLVYVVLASSVVVSLYGFYQYYFGAAVSAVEWVDGDQFPDLKLRVCSTLQNPNLLAGFLVIVMSLAAGLGCKAKRWENKSLLFGLVVMLGLCLVITYSRGAWLSVIAVIGVYGLLYNRRIFWLLLLIPIVVWCAPDIMLERLVSIANPTDTSSTLRLALWESTIAMVMDKPFMGIGWGSYWLVYPEYDFFVQNTGTTIFHAHNMYLNIAAEIGIPGLLVFLGIIYGHIRIALRCFFGSFGWTAGLMLGVIAALTGLVVNGFTDYIMFNIQLSLLFWLLNAVIVVVWQENYQQKVNKNFEKKV